MIISISTANLYSLPFKKTLDIYKKAGYSHIELAGYWKGGEWEIAQHLKNIPPLDVLTMADNSGLSIASFHDMSGVIEEGSESVISKTTYEYLKYKNIPCLIFHTPHKKQADKTWWNAYRGTLINDLNKIKSGRIICVENIFEVENYFMPLLDPYEMLDFLEEADIYLNLDTTHCAHCGIDIIKAAKIYKNRIKTIHLSDYAKGKQHLPPGSGNLDFKSFFNALDLNNIYCITVESAIEIDPCNENVSIESTVKSRKFIEQFM